MDNNQIRFLIESDYKNTNLVGRAISHLCRTIHLKEEEVTKIELCVIEAVNNSIEHAYQKQSGHDVEVKMTFDREKIEIKVCDTGNSMDPQYLSRANLLSDNPDSMEISEIPESGRGLFLIKAFMDSVSYAREDNKNCMTMIKWVNPK